MNIKKVVVVDDQEHFSNKLKTMLTELLPNVSILTANNVQSAYNFLINNDIDVLFLDVELENETGFDLLNKLPSRNFQCIFVTAHDTYAIDAIKFSALDYILKPFSLFDLQQALNKAEQQINTSQFQLNALLENIKAETHTKKIGLNTADGIYFVPIVDIIRCKADGNYTEFYLIDGKKIITSISIKNYVELLDKYHFLRVHRSHLINLKHVKKYSKSLGGSIVMIDNSEVEISNNSKEIFLEKILLA